MRWLLSVALLLLAAISLACAVQIEAQRTSPFADDGDLRDWDHYYGLASGRDYRPYLKTDWRGAIPIRQDIATATNAQLNALRTPWQYHIGVPLPDGGTSQPNENTPYARDEISWSGIYSMHKPGETNSNVVLLLVCSAQVIEGPTTERYVHRLEELRGYVLDRDRQSGAWSFSNESKRLLIIGATTTTSRDELMRQFTAAMRKQGYVPGLSDGSNVSASSGSASGKDTRSAAGGHRAGVLAGAPPPGFDGIGNVPGPRTLGEAAAGVVIPAAVIILVNTLAGLPGGGGAPSPVPVPAPPAPAGPAPVDEEAERRARQLKEHEDDLRRVREMKSFLGATAAGVRSSACPASSGCSGSPMAG